MSLNMSATLKSRFALAGILYFSSKVREAFGGSKPKAGQTVLQTIYDILKSNVDVAFERGDVASILPILLQGDEEVGKVAEHITIDRELFETDLKLRGELIDRILFGLDINVQATSGNDETSHWGAWQNSADELRLAVIPDLQAACWTFTRLIMRQQLLESKDKQFADPNRFGITFSLDEASVRANRASDAREMRDKGALGLVPMLKANGFTEDDAIGFEDYMRWLGVQLRIPRLATFGYPEFETGPGGVPWDDPTLTPTKTGRIADGTGGKPKSEPGQGDPGSPDDDDSDTPKSDKPI
jgi:hypothetical protein